MGQIHGVHYYFWMGLHRRQIHADDAKSGQQWQQAHAEGTGNSGDQNGRARIVQYAASSIHG
jgi:hypothetical protein